MSQLWHLLLYQPLVNALIFLYQLLFQNFGLAVIVLTVLIRGVLTPLTLPAMKAAKKMKELAPELEGLKKKHSKDKQALAKAQMEFYQKKGVNPAAGCLPQIIQLIVLIALYQAFIRVLRGDGEVISKLNQVLYLPLKLSPDTQINTQFLWLDLNKPDVVKIAGFPIALPGVFLLAAAVVQFFSSKLMAPSVKVASEQAKKSPEKTDDMTAIIQTQMLYLFPLMTILIGYSFPSGLILYWLTFSVFTATQQLLINKAS